MDTRTQTIAIYRKDSAHPQALACAACEVRSTALFGVLDDAGLDRIYTQIDSMTLAPDATVYDRGSAGLAVFTIREGLVRFERSSEHGDRRIVRIAGRGDLIGQEALLNRPYTDDAVACTEVHLCRIPRVLVDQLAQGRDTLPRELMLRWQKALDAAEAWVSDLSTGPARRRLLHLLRRLADHAGPDDAIWLPRRDEIGAMLDIDVRNGQPPGQRLAPRKRADADARAQRVARPRRLARRPARRGRGVIHRQALLSS